MKKNLLLLCAFMMLVTFNVKSESFPTLSEEGQEPVWYSIYSHRSAMVFKDNGLNNYVNCIKFAANTDELQWKFLKVNEDTFKIVSRADRELAHYVIDYKENANGKGRYNYNTDTEEYTIAPKNELGEYTGTHDADNRRFIAAEAGAGDLFVFKNFKQDDNFTFQIFYTATDEYVNMMSTTEAFITSYAPSDDGGNPFSAITSMDDIYNRIFVNPPKFTVENDTTWYFIENMRRGAVMTNKGYNEKIRNEKRITEDGAEKDAQLLAFIGNYGKFYLKSRAGGVISYDAASERFVMKEDIEENRGYFELIVNKNTDFGENLWALIYTAANTGVHGYNSNEGELGLYSATDPGSVFGIHDATQRYNPYEGAPEVYSPHSTEPIKWYYMKNVRSGKYITCDGLEAGASQAELIEGNQSQLFSFEGEYEPGGFVIICKNNNVELATVSTTDKTLNFTDRYFGDYFKFEKAGAYWEVKHIRTEECLNDDGANGEKIELYSQGDGGNPIEFILYNGSNKVPNTEKIRTDISISNNLLTVKGEDIQTVAIYNIAGVNIATSISNPFVYTLPNSGYYIVSVTYNDSKTENIKVISK